MIWERDGDPHDRTEPFWGDDSVTSSRILVVRRFLGDGVAALMGEEVGLVGDDLGKKFSSLIEVARGSGELEQSSLSRLRDTERAKWVKSAMVACSIGNSGRVLQ